MAYRMGADHYVDLSDVCEEFGSQILLSPGANRLIEGLVDSIQLADQFAAHPMRRAFIQWRFRIENLSSDELAELAPHLAQPEALVDRLPQSWHAIRVCRGLLDTPHQSQGVALGLELCKMPNGIPSDAERDRTGFLLELDRRGLLPEDRRSALTQRGFDERRLAAYLHQAVQKSPESILNELHERFTRENAIRLTFDWSQDGEDWRSVLLGRAFALLLRKNSLSEDDCLMVLAQMREVIDSLPASALRDRYLEVIRGIEGLGRLGTPVPFGVAEGDRFLDRALRVCGDIVAQSCEKGSALTARDLRTLLEAGDGFVYDASAKLKGSSVSRQYGGAVGTFWFAPLVHVALTLASLRAGLGDYAQRFADDWLAVEGRLSKRDLRDPFDEFFARNPSMVKRATLDKARSQINTTITEFGRTAKLDDIQRHLLLLAKHFRRAGGGLRLRRAAPSFGETDAFTGLYNRACVAARMGRLRLARKHLTSLASARPQAITQAWDDPDFKSMRRLHWFRKLLGRE